MEGIWSEGFAERLHINQSRLLSEMKSQYDFIICGSGSSGSVVARRLAENPQVSVLLVEAGGQDNVPSVTEPGKLFQNLGSERYWNCRAAPSTYLNGRAIPMNMGKVLGGGSSINVMAWLRGHRTDWDFFAAATGDPDWSYESILSVYRRIEDWRGAPDPARRGVGGPVSFSPCAIRIRSYPPRSKRHDQSEFQPSTVEWTNDGGRGRLRRHGRTDPQWTTAVRLPRLHLPLYGSAEPHGAHADAGPESDVRG